jgi:aldose sugar dehydrogenase
MRASSFFALLFALGPAAPATAAGPDAIASERGRVQLVEVARGLSHPWGMALLPDGRVLVTERPGRLRLIDAEGTISAPIRGVPALFAEGQGGLLDVAISPQFAQDALVYFCYAEPGRGGAGTALRRARLDGDALRDSTLLFRQKHRFATDHHFGCRIVFDRNEHLFLTLGERGQRALAQRLDRHLGKIVRLQPDGRVPPDNPFVSRRDALPEIWSSGHRNVQGAALHPGSGELWTHEHGPMGGDEINVARAGRNYGWPRATHGLDYSGEPIPESRGADAAGTETPAHVWSHSPAVSGMAFCAADGCGPWRGNLFVGALAQRALLRLELDGERVLHEERLLEPLRERIRDIEAAPDGSLYLLTDAARGRLLRVQIFPGS